MQLSITTASDRGHANILDRLARTPLAFVAGSVVYCFLPDVSDRHKAAIREHQGICASEGAAASPDLPWMPFRHASRSWFDEAEQGILRAP
jgi:hypothetical protein